MEANGMQCSNHPWEALPQLATSAWSFHASPSRGGHELAIKSNKTHQISPRCGMIWNGLGPTIWIGRWNSLDKNIYFNMLRILATYCLHVYLHLFAISEWFLQGVCRASSWSSSLKALSFVPGCSFSNFSVAHMARYSTISAVSAVSESHWVSDMLRQCRGPACGPGVQRTGCAAKRDAPSREESRLQFASLLLHFSALAFLGVWLLWQVELRCIFRFEIPPSVTILVRT